MPPTRSGWTSEATWEFLFSSEEEKQLSALLEYNASSTITTSSLVVDSTLATTNAVQVTVCASKSGDRKSPERYTGLAADDPCTASQHRTCDTSVPQHVERQWDRSAEEQPDLEITASHHTNSGRNTIATGSELDGQ